jgi:hypothetical protein
MKILRWRQVRKKSSDETPQPTHNEVVKESPESITLTRSQPHTVRLRNVKRIKRTR